MSEFDEDTLEFLGVLDPSTRRIYSAGLTAFQAFYKPYGTIKDFLDRVEEDSLKLRNEKTRVARNALNEFVEWLKEKGYKPKTVRAYIAAIQSEAKYFDLSITTRYVNVPASRPFSQKYPWKLEDVAKFVGMIETPEYKSIAVSLFQSGLSISDLLALTYGDILVEYESGIIPLCFDLARIKTDIPYMSFIGKWGIDLLRQHLSEKKPSPEDHIYNKTDRAE
ncbi:MAG: hypothetical protein QXF26_09615 [Candidatus Bathyarchaeia archaeon]